MTHVREKHNRWQAVCTNKRTRPPTTEVSTLEWSFVLLGTASSTSLKVIIMANVKAVTGQFSPVAGNTVRRCYDASNNFLGVIVKAKGGYRITRIDGKTRMKATLAEAFASVRRAN